MQFQTYCSVLNYAVSRSASGTYQDTSRSSPRTTMRGTVRPRGTQNDMVPHEQTIVGFSHARSTGVLDEIGHLTSEPGPWRPHRNRALGMFDEP